MSETPQDVEENLGFWHKRGPMPTLTKYCIGLAVLFGYRLLLGLVGKSGK